MPRKRVLTRCQQANTDVIDWDEVSCGRKTNTPYYRSSSPPCNDDANKRRFSIRRTIFGIVRFRTISICVFLAMFVFVFLPLILPKWIFAIGRNLLMSRPAVLYGTPTNWKDVMGCLSRTHRREVRESLEMSKDNKNHLAHLPLNPDVVWNWSRYSSPPPDDDGDSASTNSNNNNNNNNTEPREKSIPRRRLLIAQYSGKGSYEKLLREVEPINKAYAKKWGHDYTALIGTALKFPGFVYDQPQTDSTSTSRNRHSEQRSKNHRYCRYFIGPNSTDDSPSTPSSALSSNYDYESQSTFNKIPLLFRAMEESPQKYDQVLILDADTMIVDFEYDITSLLLSSNPAGNDDDNSDSNSNGNSSSNDKSRKESVSNENGSNTIGSRGINHTSHQSIDDSSNINKRTKSNQDEDLSYFLAAFRVWKFDWISTWDVNAGITLWNLRHPSTRIVAEDWLKLSLSDPKEVLLKNDDQYYLQRSLQKVTNRYTSGRGANKKKSMVRFGMRPFRNWWNRYSILPAILDYYSKCTNVDTSDSWDITASGGSVPRRYDDNAYDGVGILAIRDEFEYYTATVVKHFKRDSASWSRTGLEQRVLRIREVKAQICLKWPKYCIA